MSKNARFSRGIDAAELGLVKRIGAFGNQIFLYVWLTSLSNNSHTSHEYTIHEMRGKFGEFVIIYERSSSPRPCLFNITIR